MDFIKTSSLRALIELTFQRNWNGLIWMSRKGVITKRVKTVQTALSRKRPTAQSGWPRNECSASAKNPSVRSAKVQPHRPITHHDPGNMSRGRPSHTTHAMPRTTMPREPGTSLAAAQPLAYHGRCAVRAGKTSRVRPRTSAKSHPSDPAADRRIRPATTVPTRPRPDVRPIVPTDRPNAAVDPKPVSHIFKPGLTLSRL
ncbi:unnamed protein product [Microthlaspi erraticum]|uniref:Uncharacterized protein n=1 Tax=Microthlaspi erraticum TaxID=1685480 RepID=A0A6D2KUY7_9BRAS|nr:unnamed protein product [Microthlaspi erraticum]